MDTNKGSLTEIDHVVIMVANLEQSIKWYTSSFSCKEIYRGKTLAILAFKNTKVVLSLPSEQRPHLGFLREDAASFGELKEQGDYCISTFISDPSGNPVEVVATPCEELLASRPTEHTE